MKTLLALLTTQVVLAIGSVSAQTTVVHSTLLNPRATFLRVNADNPLPPDINDLASLGVSPGDYLLVTVYGDYSWQVGQPDTRRNLLCVFSSSTTLLSDGLLVRVPDAIATNYAFVTGNTYFGNLPTDIPEDFYLAGTPTNPNPLLVQVPIGATHLFVGVNDSLYNDNVDPDSDFGYSLALYGGAPGGGQVPQPGLAVLDLNGATESGGLPVSSNLPGPYFGGVSVGGTLTIDFAGEANQPIYLLLGPLNPGVADYTMFGIGQLDIGTPDTTGDGLPESLFVVANGFMPLTLFDLAFNTGPTGQDAVVLPMNSALPSGLSLGTYQAVMASSGGLRISNAVSLTVN